MSKTSNSILVKSTKLCLFLFCKFYSQNYYWKSIVISLGLFAFSNFFIVEAYSETTATKNLEIRCIHMYEKFKIMGEENLRKRYPAKTIMNACLNLYNDPDWNFKGKNSIDKKFPSGMANKLDSEVISAVRIGENKYLVKFQICSESNLRSTYLLITTDKEQFLGKIIKNYKGKCADLWALMRAENPNVVQISWNYPQIHDFQMVRKLM